MGVAENRKKRSGWGGARAKAGRKKQFEERVPITFDDEVATRDQLDAIAAAEGVTRAEIIRRAIRHYLKTHEQIW